jgi:hypothetical protein
MKINKALISELIEECKGKSKGDEVNEVIEEKYQVWTTDGDAIDNEDVSKILKTAKSEADAYDQIISLPEFVDIADQIVVECVEESNSVDPYGMAGGYIIS